MKTKKLLALLLAGVMSASLLTGCGGGNNENAATDNGDASGTETTSDLAYVQDKGKMVIGYTVYEPMNYTDENGEFTGFDTEFAKAVCEKLGVEPEFVEINWDTKVVELDAKSIDCIWNGMTITDDLKENIAVSDPYVKNMQVIVIKDSNKDTFTDTASLSGANLVAEAGSAGQAAIEADENLSQANLTTVTKQTDALLEIESGASDAAVLDWTLAKSMIGEGTDFADLMMIDGVELSVEEYGIGFRKDSDLCTEVNKIMAELVEDGTLPALAEKYGLSLAE
ncbi:transporter substrate-binding domain-containing protein [Anaerotruncus colihominis]|uniref:transporter substrate-binding domain-containing protein n=1 Tax=Anaerotruncus colihominis TaxID=169435 RepID=UPI00243038E5|nr:transporter substrate-binding domain-containing protein [Anaerotruncus colihominis]